MSRHIIWLTVVVAMVLLVQLDKSSCQEIQVNLAELVKVQYDTIGGLFNWIRCYFDCDYCLAKVEMEHNGCWGPNEGDHGVYGASRRDRRCGSNPKKFFFNRPSGGQCHCCPA